MLVKMRAEGGETGAAVICDRNVLWLNDASYSRG